MKSREKLRTIALAVLAAASLPAARGAVASDEQIVSLDMGGAFPFGKFRDPESPSGSDKPTNRALGGPGYLAGGQYIYQIDPANGVGLDVNYSGDGGHTITEANQVGTVVTSESKLTVEALGRYVFFPEDDYNPYFILGLGFNRVDGKATFNSGPGSTNPSSTLFNSHYDSFACSLGLGIETAIEKPVIMGIETRWRYLGSHDFAVPNTSGTLPFRAGNEITLALRWGVRF